jgi:class 3 adenylate cyclase
MEAERLSIEQAKSEELLVNLLPATIANILKTGEQTIASRFSNVVIMFAHVVGLTKLQDELEMKELFQLVNTIFCKFDDITENHKIEKIKTIGSSYMVASGLHSGDSKTMISNDVARMINAAIEMIDYIQSLNNKGDISVVQLNKLGLGIRVGIHVGPVVAGVIGKKKFVSIIIDSIYCILIVIYLLGI